MKPSLRTLASRRSAWGLTALTLLLASCGGGGVGSPLTLSGEVHGLAPTLQGRPTAGMLVLSVNGISQTFSTGSYADKTAISFSRTFGVGETYVIAVEKHPEGQICAVTRAGTGKLDAAVSDVRVDCHTTRLNDTGIAGTTSAEVTARAPDSQSGRDAERAKLTKVGSGAVGFDFTRICPTGEQADASGGCTAQVQWATAANSCVRDNVTGLMWRRADTAYAGVVPADSERVCERVGWRAPTVHELLSIVHAGQASAPYVDTDFFNVASARFFSSEIYRDLPQNERWTVDLASAGMATKYSAGGGPEQRRALWVSGTSALDDPASSAYTRSDVGTSYTIIDTRRELMWLVPKVVSPSDWAAAVASIDAVRAAAPGGYTDWRLPNRNELDALVNRSLANPAMDPAVSVAIPSPQAASVVYWTSSVDVGSPARAWTIDFTYGDVSTMLKTSTARLIYVRNRVFNPAPTTP